MERTLEYAEMTNARELYSLQELDLALDRIQEKTAKSEEELHAGLDLNHVETALQEVTERLEQVQSQHSSLALEAESHRERSTRLDDQLYGGAITNPKDLESLEPEASNARELLERQDTELLELSLQVEESRNRQDALEKELADGRSAWQVREAELEKTIASWAAEREAVSAQRNDLAVTLEPSSLQRYESLRRAKGGLAVAKVERGLCQACRMSLPTQQQQKVRIGRQTVLCNSCGRILF